MTHRKAQHEFNQLLYGDTRAPAPKYAHRRSPTYCVPLSQQRTNTWFTNRSSFGSCCYTFAPHISHQRQEAASPAKQILLVFERKLRISVKVGVCIIQTGGCSALRREEDGHSTTVSSRAQAPQKMQAAKLRVSVYELATRGPPARCYYRASHLA
jgi:hypothetical protein